MKCRDIKKLLTAYAGDELSAEKRRFVETHLGDCPSCRKELDQLLEMKQALASVRETAPVRDIKGAVMDKLETTEKTKPAGQKWRRLSFSALPATVLLAVLLVLQPWVASPAAIVAKARENAEKLTSYRITSEVANADDEAYSFEILFSAPDKWHVTVDSSSDDDDIEYIRIDDITWYTESSAPDTVRGAMTWSLTTGQTPLSREMSLEILDYLMDIEELPVVTFDDTECRHYTGTYDFEKSLRQSSADAVSRGYPPISEETITEQLAEIEEQGPNVTFDLLIGKDDSLMRRMTVTSSFLDQGSDEWVSSVLTTTYTDLNATINIEPPIDTQGNLLEGWLSTVPKTPNIESQTSYTIDNYDPSVRSIQYTINLTNISDESLEGFDFRFMADFPDEIDSTRSLISTRYFIPDRDIPFTVLRSGQTVNYVCEFNYDATKVDPAVMVEMIEKSRVLIRYGLDSDGFYDETIRFTVPFSLYSLSDEVPENLAPQELKPVFEYTIEETAAYAGGTTTGTINGREYLFVECSSSGLSPAAPAGILILDVTDRTKPVKAGYIDTGDSSTYLVGTALNGTTLYVFAPDYLWVIDVSNPANPTEITRIDGMEVRAMVTKGDYAFLSTPDNKIVSCDISNPGRPVELDRVTITNRSTVQLEIAGDLLFTKANNVIYLIDVTEPAAIRITDELAAAELTDDNAETHIMAWNVQDNRLYAALSGDKGDGIATVIVTAEGLSPIDYLELPGREVSGWMTISGDDLFVSTRSSLRELQSGERILRLDLSYPQRPALTATGQLPGIWSFLKESSSYVSSYTFIDDYLYWYIGGDPNPALIEIFDLSGL